MAKTRTIVELAQSDDWTSVKDFLRNRLDNGAITMKEYLTRLKKIKEDEIRSTKK